MKFEFDAAKEVSIVEVSTAITMAETLVYIRRSATKTKDKGKGIMEESESAMTKMKRQHEQERLGLARVEADKELTQRLQAEERDKYSGVDQVKMLVDLINQRKNHFAVKRAKERRNKPMTQAQQRTYMINYIKHMGSHTLQQLNIQSLTRRFTWKNLGNTRRSSRLCLISILHTKEFFNMLVTHVSNNVLRRVIADYEISTVCEGVGEGGVGSAELHNHHPHPLQHLPQPELVVAPTYHQTKEFAWVFFLATKDETPKILKNFIVGIENQMDHKVKTIRCDNRTNFKNRIMIEFYEIKGIRREFSVAMTPHQNGVAERKNRTLIEAARTMLADSKLPATIWAEAVNTACYSINSKAFRVFNIRTKIVEENLHITFLENKPNVTGIRPNWMFDIDTLTMSMNYQLVFMGNQTNGNAITKANIDAGQAGKKIVPDPQYVLLPLLTSNSQGPKSSEDEVVDDAKIKNPGKERAQMNESKNVFGQDKDVNGNRIFTHVSAAGSTYDTADTRIFSGAYGDEVEGAEADFNNLELTIVVIQRDDGIFINQDKYVAIILKKFDFSLVKEASTPIDTNKALLKDEEAGDVDVHLYRSMIGSLRYLKGQPKLSLCYPKDSPFNLAAFLDSDYAGASLDRKSTTGEYVAAANYCRHTYTGSGGVSTASRMISTAEESVSTAGASMPVSTAGMIDKAVRLQEEFDEEERQRIARVHEAAQTFTEEE
nr:hypothetical protein [Tanacetum cinerariifolium]